MATTEFIAAIELGSSKITGIAGKRHGDGSMEILSYAEEKSNGAIRKGVVYNLDKTAQYLTNIINQMEGDLSESIGKVYVGLGGQSTHTVKNQVCRDLEHESLITDELLEELINEDRNFPYKDMELQDVFPQEYKVDNVEQKEPTGIKGNHLEGRFMNVVSRISLKKNILQCFERAKINVAGILLSPVVCANVVLTESEKRSGCVLVDFGADSTTVTIYKNNILRFLSVIPLGGDTITKDIATLNIMEDEAEEIKHLYGNTQLEEYDEENEGEEPTFKLESDGRSFKISQLNELVQARAEEIVANVANQIQQAGYNENRLISGMIITGGGSNLRNIDTLIRKKSGFERIRFARHIQERIESDSNVITKDGTQATLFGLLFAGKENCIQSDEPKEPVQENEPIEATGTAEGVQPESNSRTADNEPVPVHETTQEDLFRNDEELKKLEGKEAQKKAEEEKQRQAQLEKEKEEKKKKKKKKMNIFSQFSKKAMDFFDDNGQDLKD